MEIFFFFLYNEAENKKGMVMNMNNKNWVSVWGNAVSIAEHHPEAYAKYITLRYPVYIPFDGDTLRFTFDNYCGSEAVTVTRATVSAATSPVYEKMPLACPCKKETICDITFSKNESVTMEAHQTAVSDPVSFPVKKGMTLTVSLYFADFTLMQSAVLVTGPLSKGFFSLGDQTHADALPMDTTKTTNWFYFLRCTIDSPETVEALQRIADLSDVYHCAPPVTSAANALESSLGSKKVVMATDGAWNVGTFLGPSADFDYGVGVLPYMKEKVTICTGGPNVVFSTTEHPEEAMEWLKWYYQEENSWSLIEAGTWMPILDSWYTDPEKTDKWISNPNYPDKDMYKSAVVDYAMNNAQSTSWYYVNGTEEFNATLDSVFSSVWAGEETMEEAINENLEELQDIFAENNG